MRKGKSISVTIPAEVSSKGWRCVKDVFRYCSDRTHFKMSHERCSPESCGHYQTLTQQVMFRRTANDYSY